jgi:hypothetical protein
MMLPAYAAVHYVKMGGNGCSTYPADTAFSSHIVMVDRGGCTFFRKALNVQVSTSILLPSALTSTLPQAAGGAMMVVANHEDTMFGMTVDPHEAVATAPLSIL